MGQREVEPLASMDTAQKGEFQGYRPRLQNLHIMLGTASNAATHLTRLLS